MSPIPYVTSALLKLLVFFTLLLQALRVPHSLPRPGAAAREWGGEREQSRRTLPIDHWGKEKEEAGTELPGSFCPHLPCPLLLEW